MGDSFHIRHQVQPDFLLSTLLGVSKALSQEDLLSFVQSMGFRPKLLAEQLRWGERLGLLKRREKTAIGPVDLTSSGRLLVFSRLCDHPWHTNSYTYFILAFGTGRHLSPTGFHGPIGPSVKRSCGQERSTTTEGRLPSS